MSGAQRRTSKLDRVSGYSSMIRCDPTVMASPSRWAAEQGGRKVDLGEVEIGQITDEFIALEAVGIRLHLPGKAGLDVPVLSAAHVRHRASRSESIRVQRPIIPDKRVDCRCW